MHVHMTHANVILKSYFALHVCYLFINILSQTAINLNSFKHLVLLFLSKTFHTEKVRNPILEPEIIKNYHRQDTYK